jgi:hypothetical protein
MAVTKQTYIALPTWTNIQAANLLEDAFIGAGFMTDWYDAFRANNIEHRILEIEYDGTKDYGTCYYWFAIDSNSIRVSVTSGWDSTANIPTGTQYQDFYSTDTSTVANHAIIASSLVATTQLDLVRYTSAINSDYSWFVLRNGSTPVPFMIAPASTPIVPWLDLDKFLFHHFVRTTYASSPSTNSTLAGIRFNDSYRVRRSYRDGQGVSTATGNFGYISTTFPLFSYRSLANTPSGATSTPAETAHNVAVPYGFTSNSAFESEYTPIVFGYSYSPYVLDPVPIDFGMQFSYTPSAFQFADRVVVDAGIEEWEVFDFRNNSTTTSASPLMLARVV